MRHSKVAMLRARARRDIQASSAVLEELGEWFWSAATMARMGLVVVREVDRVAVKAAVGERDKGRGGPGDIEGQSANVGAGMEDRKFDLLCYCLGEEMLNHILASTQLLAETADISNVQQPIPDFDPAMFDYLTDVDLFDMFDPNFDLNGIDAALQGNLDLSFPTQFS